MTETFSYPEPSRRSDVSALQTFQTRQITALTFLWSTSRLIQTNVFKSHIIFSFLAIVPNKSTSFIWRIGALQNLQKLLFPYDIPVIYMQLQQLIFARWRLISHVVCIGIIFIAFWSQSKRSYLQGVPEPLGALARGSGYENVTGWDSCDFTKPFAKID